VFVLNVFLWIYCYYWYFAIASTTIVFVFCLFNIFFGDLLMNFMAIMYLY